MHLEFTNLYLKYQTGDGSHRSPLEWYKLAVDKVLVVLQQYNNGFHDSILHMENVWGCSTCLHSVGVQRFGWPPFRADIRRRCRLRCHLHGQYHHNVFHKKSHVATLLQKTTATH